MERKKLFITEKDIDNDQLKNALAKWTHQWTQRALSTAPADRERVERGIRDLLLVAGRPEETPIVWVDSPAVMLPAIRAAGTSSTDWESRFYDRMRTYQAAVYYARKSAPHSTVLRAVERYLDRALSRSVSQEAAYCVRKSIRASLRNTIHNWINNTIGNGVLLNMRKSALRYCMDRVDLDAMRDRYGATYDAFYQAAFHAADYALGGEPNATSVHPANTTWDGKVIPFEDAATITINAALARARKECVGYRLYLWTLLHWGEFLPTGRWEPIRDNGIGLAYYAFFRDILGLSIAPKRGRLKGKDLIKAYEDATSAGWVWFGERFVVVCEPPIIQRVDRSYNLHATDGPAVIWRDGTALWYIHEVCVPRDVVETPEKITPSRVNKERDAEVRRIMIDRMGAERYLRRIEATVRHEDTDQYGFPRRLLVANMRDIEPLCIVEVVNPTPEPIGYTPEKGENGVWRGNRWHKKYMLRVPPRCQTTQEALAWTFRVSPEEYHPAIET
jgi:hypothetical protein